MRACYEAALKDGSAILVYDTPVGAGLTRLVSRARAASTSVPLLDRARESAEGCTRFYAVAGGVNAIVQPAWPLRVEGTAGFLERLESVSIEHLGPG